MVITTSITCVARAEVRCCSRATYGIAVRVFASNAAKLDGSSARSTLGAARPKPQEHPVAGWPSGVVAATTRDGKSEKRDGELSSQHLRHSPQDARRPENRP